MTSVWQFIFLVVLVLNALVWGYALGQRHADFPAPERPADSVAAEPAHAQLLFTEDGCRVYRFRFQGVSGHFANCHDSGAKYPSGQQVAP